MISNNQCYLELFVCLSSSLYTNIPNQFNKFEFGKFGKFKGGN